MLRQHTIQTITSSHMHVCVYCVRVCLETQSMLICLKILCVQGLSLVPGLSVGSWKEGG